MEQLTKKEYLMLIGSQNSVISELKEVDMGN